MFGIRSILSLVDLSAASRPVIEAALLCAQRFRSRVILYHASPNLKGEEQISSLRRDFQKLLSEVKEKMAVDVDQTQILIASEDFPTGPMLRQLCSDVEMVVIGAGRIGSVDKKREKVVKFVNSCQQPVLVIPNEHTIKDVRQILFCTSFDELKDNVPLEIIKYFANEFSAEVRLAHVKTHNGKPNEDHVKRSRYEGSFFEPEVKYSYKLIRNSDVVDGINHYVKKKGDNDLLVMIKRKEFIFDRLFGKNFTFRMLQQAEIPLLILKEPQLN